MKYRLFNFVAIISILLFVGGFIGMTYYVDPLFHYHAPSENIEYPLWSERYQNDGILRNFDYDCVITGTSMTENFVASRWDGYFGTQSIKIPLSGASYKEIDEQLRRAYSYNDGIRMVFRALDLSNMVSDKDALSYEEYPEYLYDDRWTNDIHYVLNKDIFFDYTCYVFEFMKQGGKTTSFDAYKRWHDSYTYDAKKLLEEYQFAEKTDVVSEGLTQEQRNQLVANLTQNVIETVVAHPQTQFYFYLPPYCALWWYDRLREGKFNEVIETQRIAFELLLPYDNVHIYSFFDDYIFICSLGYYIDSVHYNMEYSNQIIDKIAEGTGLISKDNLDQYFYALTFYELFDYENYFQGILGE